MSKQNASEVLGSVYVDLYIATQPGRKGVTKAFTEETAFKLARAAGEVADMRRTSDPRRCAARMTLLSVLTYCCAQIAAAASTTHWPSQRRRLGYAFNNLSEAKSWLEEA